jgi:hypothetical protein
MLNQDRIEAVTKKLLAMWESGDLPEDHPARETYDCLMKLPELLRVPKDHPVLFSAA